MLLFCSPVAFAIPFQYTCFDADVIVIRNIDELFDALPHSAVAQFLGMTKTKKAAAPRQSTDVAAAAISDSAAAAISDCIPVDAKVQAKFSASTFNTGVLVIEPSAATFEQIVNAFSSYKESWSWADQDLLVDLFRPQWVHLPWVFNAQKRCVVFAMEQSCAICCQIQVCFVLLSMFLYRPDLWNAAVDEIKVIHYIGGKPWQSEEELKKDFEDNSPYWPIFDLWQQAHDGTAYMFIMNGVPIYVFTYSHSNMMCSYKLMCLELLLFFFFCNSLTISFFLSHFRLGSPHRAPLPILPTPQYRAF